MITQEKIRNKNENLQNHYTKMLHLGKKNQRKNKQTNAKIIPPNEYVEARQILQ